MNDYLSHITNQVGFYMTTIAMPIGAILNLLSIFIFTRPNLNRTNMGFLFIWQKAIDTIVLFSYTFIFRAPYLFDYDLFVLSNASCKLFSFYRRFMVFMSSAIMVFIAFDRFLFVHYHNKFKFMRRKRNLMLIIGILALFVSLICIDNFFFSIHEIKTVKSFFNVTNNSTEQITSNRLICTSSDLGNMIADVLIVSFRVYIPITLILIFNFILIRDLVKSKNRFKFKIHKKEIQFTFTVIFASFVFFVLYFPISVLVLLKNVFVFTGVVYSQEILEFCFNIAVEISSLYLVIEFFILLAVNKVFRNEVIQFFTALKLRYSPSNNDIDTNHSNLGSLANSSIRL